MNLLHLRTSSILFREILRPKVSHARSFSVVVNDFQNSKLEWIYKKKDLTGSNSVVKADFLAWAEKCSALSGVKLTDDMKESWVEAHEAYFGGTSNYDEFKA